MDFKFTASKQTSAHLFLWVSLVLIIAFFIFQAWIAWPGYTNNDAQTTLVLSKHNWHPAIMAWLLEGLYALFGVHVYHLLLLNLIPFYLGIWILLLGIFKKTNSWYTLWLALPFYEGNIFYNQIYQGSSSFNLSWIVLLYALVLYTILNPLKKQKTKIVFYGLTGFVFIIALLSRFNAIFHIWPITFVWIGLYLQKTDLKFWPYVRKFIALAVLSGVICSCLVLGLNKMLTVSELGNCYPATPTLMHQISATGAPAFDENCFNEEWWSDEWKNEPHRMEKLSNYVKIHNLDADRYTRRIGAPFKDQIDLKERGKKWIYAISHYPLNYFNYLKPYYKKLWFSSQQKKLKHDIKRLNTRKHLVWFPRAWCPVSQHEKEKYEKIANSIPEEEINIRWTPTQEKVENYLNQFLPALKIFWYIVLNFFVLLTSVFMFLRDRKNILLLFSASTAFAGILGAILIPMFSPTASLRYMMPVIICAIFSCVGTGVAYGKNILTKISFKKKAIFNLKFVWITMSFVFLLCGYRFYFEGPLFAHIKKSGWENKTARVDIRGFGDLDVEVIDKTPEINVSYPNWCSKKDEKNCAVLNIPIQRQWSEYNISFKIKGKGKVRISLKGPDAKEKGVRYPVVVDYKNFEINKIKKFTDEKSLWHDNPYDTQEKEVIDGEEIFFSISIRQNHLKLRDLITNYKYDYTIHWKIFFLALLLSCLLSTLLIFLFSQNEKKLFVLIYFSFLFFPMLNISTEKISEQENRTLSKFPELFSDGRINNNFGIEFNDWLNDRFGGRTKLIDLRFNLMYRLNGKTANEKAFIGDDGWMFETAGTKYIPSLKEQQEQIKKTATLLKQFNDRFKNKNIPIYIVLIPDRNQFLEEYWKRYYIPQQRLNIKNELEKELKNYTNIHLFDIENELLKEKDLQNIFWKEDNHLTWRGISLLFTKIFDIIKLYLPSDSNIELDIKDEYITRDVSTSIAAKLGMPNKIKMNYFQTFTRLNMKNLPHERIEAKESSPEAHFPQYIHDKTETAPIDKTVVFYGPCHAEDAYNVFRTLFKESIKIRPNSPKELAPYLTKKVKNLFKLDANSAFIIMIMDPYLTILDSNDILTNALKD